MHLNQKHISVIQDALVDFNQSMGTSNFECSAIRLSAIVETVMELAEDGDERAWNPPASDETEIDDNFLGEPVEAVETPNLHQRILALDAEGKKPTEIAKELGVSKPTVYNHLKFKREQEAK